MTTLTLNKFSAKIGDKKIVSDISLSVNPGEVHIIMGANGSGKTSLLNAIAGHPKYTVSGSVKLGSSYITRLKPDERARKGVFLSLQHVPEIDGINLAYFLYKSNKELNNETLKIVDFYGKAKEIARKYDIDEDFLNRPLNAGLSGGEKKQSEILQLLMIRPAYAFLDEIDSGIDMNSIKKIKKAVGHLRKKGTGFVIVTHYLPMAKELKPDYVHIIENGRIKDSGHVNILDKVNKKGL